MEEIRLKIAIMDDIDSNLTLMARALEKHGFEVCTARDGATAINMVKTERPDLVIMDLNMPDMNGWEATDRLKADPETARIPIAALRATIEKGDEGRLSLGGFDGWCAKPIKIKPFIDQVYAWLDPDI